MNDEQKITKIKEELEFLWIDENTAEPLTGDKLLHEALKNPVEYKDLLNHLINIQNIIFGK